MDEKTIQAGREALELLKRIVAEYKTTDGYDVTDEMAVDLEKAEILIETYHGS